jgi:hypothetical protein
MAPAVGATEKSYTTSADAQVETTAIIDIMEISRKLSPY